jgi:sarcosine oxidase
MPNASDVIVVGAGVLGACLAHALTLRGRRVTIIDRLPAGSALAASGGESRLIRFAHGDDETATRAAWRSLAMWRDLQQQTGTRLLRQVGLAWFAGEDDAWERDSLDVLRRCDIPVETLSPAAGRELFPDLGTDDLRHVLHEPAAGIIAAGAAVRALVADAERRGARFVSAAARPDGADVEAGGRRWSAGQVVWACGGWTAALFPELLSARIIQQDSCYFEAGPEWRSPPLVAWGDHLGGVVGTGVMPEGRGVKVGLHAPGPDVDLAGGRVPDGALATLARGYLARRFPSLAHARLLATDVQATTEVRRAVELESAATVGAVDMVRHPDHDSVWILGDGSGSVYKTAPLIGATMADVLDRA